MKSWFAPLFLFLLLFCASCVPSSLSYSVPVTSYANNTDIPENPTILAKSPTPQEGVQEPTFVDIPFLSPTDIVPCLTPVTPEALPTIIATKVEQEDWFDKHFLLEKDLPPGAILINKLPKKERKKLVVTGPGQVYGICGSQLNEYLQKNWVLSSLRFDLSRDDDKTCILGKTDEKTIQNGISKKFPELPLSKQEELTEQYTQQSINLIKRLINSYPKRAFDLFEAFAFRNDYDENGTITGVSLHIIGNPYPPTGQWPLRGIIDIPLPEPTTTPTS